QLLGRSCGTGPRRNRFLRLRSASGFPIQDPLGFVICDAAPIQRQPFILECYSHLPPVWRDEKLVAHALVVARLCATTRPRRSPRSERNSMHIATQLALF